MAVVNYNFTPNQTVYVIRDCTTAPNPSIRVEKGEVIRVRINALITETTIEYDIRLENYSGTNVFEEVDVFVDLATAVAEYQVRLTPGGSP